MNEAILTFWKTLFIAFLASSMLAVWVTPESTGAVIAQLHKGYIAEMNKP